MPILEKLGHIGSFIGGIAAGGALVVAVLGFSYAQEQINASRENDLLAAYRDFRQTQIEKPELIQPDSVRLQTDPVFRHQFEAFLSVVLSTHEQTLATFPDDKGWKITVDDGLQMYKAYLNSDYINYCEFSPALRTRIDFVTKSHKDCGW